MLAGDSWDLEVHIHPEGTQIGKTLFSRTSKAAFATRKLTMAACDLMFMRSLESRRKETWILVYAVWTLKTLSKQTCLMLTKKVEILNLASLVLEEQSQFPGVDLRKGSKWLASFT